MQVQLDGTRRVTPLVHSPFDDRNGTVSYDGRWLAYESNDSGRFEVRPGHFSVGRRELTGARWRHPSSFAAGRWMPPSAPVQPMPRWRVVRKRPD